MTNIDKPKKKDRKNAIIIRINKLTHHADTHAKKRYEKDLHAAKSAESSAAKPQKERQGPVETKDEKQGVYAENYRRAAVNATPVKDVETKKSSGMYHGSLPVGGTNSKKIYRKNHPVSGIKKSDAAPHVKKMMIKRMKG